MGGALWPRVSLEGDVGDVTRRRVLELDIIRVAGVCTVAFSAVPAGHRRIVEHLSCSVYVASSGALRYVAFLASNFTAPREFYPYTRSVADAGQYFVHAPTLFPFEAGETPLVYAFADAQPIQELTCTATGRDITL